MKPKYLLLQVSTTDPSRFKYPALNFSFPWGDHLVKTKMVFVTRRGAVASAERLNEEARKYKPLYGIGDYKWDWAQLGDHQGYVNYMGRMETWEKEERKRARMPADQRKELPACLTPKPPVAVFPPSATQQNITQALQVLSTPDNYDALALLVSKLELTVGSLQNEIKTLEEVLSEEMDAHKKAIVALGEVIKGMDDRIEDIEHLVDFKVNTL